MSTLEEWEKFLDKLDWEGMTGMLAGGLVFFPTELRQDASIAYDALERMQEVIRFKESELGIQEEPF